MIELRAENLVIGMTILDVESERLPSFQAEIAIKFIHPKGKVEFETRSVWFALEDWDSFVGLLENSGQECSISTMDQEVKLALFLDKSHVKFRSYARRRVAGVGSAEQQIDISCGSEFTGLFLAFAKSIRSTCLSLNT